MDYYQEILYNLTLYNPLNKKIRLGHNGDGGYVIVDEKSGYDCFISAGIGNETTFEEDFIKYMPNIKEYLLFDGTIENSPFINEKITFYRKNIGINNDGGTTDLKEYIDKYSDVFIKMDIEGAEWLWFNELGNSLKKIKQIVFEGHAFFPHLFLPQIEMGGIGHMMEKSPDEWTQYILNSLKKLNETHYLVHAHQNQLPPFVKIGDNNYPTYYELTYIRKDCGITGFNEENVPVEGLDYPSGSKQLPVGTCDRQMNFWPFKIDKI
jgi:hypothetical protein